MSLHKRENYGFVGPMDLSLLPQHIVDLFKDSYDLSSDFKFRKSPFLVTDTALSRYQVPKAFWKFLNGLENKWTKDCIETGIKVSTQNIDDITPAHYPLAGKMIKRAIEWLSLNKNSKILVAGSISPWIECICLNYGFESITTSDYQIKEVEDERIRFVHANEIVNYKYDLIISFSSIEHDGLGRYCDPINPYGPFNAVNEFYESLNYNGKLICGIPVVLNNLESSSRVCGNACVIFSQKSIDKLFRQFELLNVVPMSNAEKFPSWQNQPIFILNKKV